MVMPTLCGYQNNGGPLRSNHADSLKEWKRIPIPAKIVCWRFGLLPCRKSLKRLIIMI